jgi:hypothetical protein
MRIHSRIPAGAVAGADIFGSSELAKGERVVDFEVDIENLPMRGKVVLRERTVVAMAHELGYHCVLTSTYEAEMSDMIAEMDRLRDREAHLIDIEAALGAVSG